MNQMKIRIQLAGAILLLALLAPALNTGCVTPGHDPVVVQAERITELAVDVFDGFLRWEHNNRDDLAGTPTVKAAADHIRAHAQDWLTSARVMTKAYKQNRTPENKANLETALAVLEAGVEEAKRSWLYREPMRGAMTPALLAALLAAAIELGKMAPKWIKDMKGRGELTPEEEALLDKRIAELKYQEHWKI